MRTSGSAEVQHCHTALDQDELPLLKQLGFIQVKNHDEGVQLYPSACNLPITPIPQLAPPPNKPDQTHINKSLRLKGSPEPNEPKPVQLASFLSKLKYLYDETDQLEGVLAMPTGTGDTRTTIKAQAAKVRNQLELKYRAIPLTMQAETFIEGYKPTPSRRVYNPLQTIRDRRFRPKPKKKPPLLWDVSITEQIQDLRWRYQTMRIQSHYTRAEKPRKRSRDILLPSIEPKNEFLMPTAPQKPRSATVTRIEADQTSELIERLRSRHDSMDHDTDTDTDGEHVRHRRPTFCRNAANVAETWNRLYRTSSRKSGASDTCASIAIKTNSRSSSDDIGSPSACRQARSQSIEEFPMLTVTDAQGSDVSIFAPTSRRYTGASTTGSTGSPIGALGSANASGTSVTPSLTSTTVPSIGTSTGSTRKRPAEYHKAPWESSVCRIETDLKFLNLLYKIALGRCDSYKLRDDHCCARFKAACASIDEQGRRTSSCLALAQYLEEVENDLAERNTKLEQGVALQVDAVRVATDLIIRDVNTTLNKDLRDITSRMEKAIVCRSSTVSTYLCYAFIEYVVLMVMWIVWGGMKVWRFLLAILSGVRFCCNGLAS